jgi:hypothetical protein
VATLTWLHLSDLHAGRPQWDSGRVTETLVSDLRKLAGEGLRPDLLFFTGDAAFRRADGAPVESLERKAERAIEVALEVLRPGGVGPRTFPGAAQRLSAMARSAARARKPLRVMWCSAA